ncbi:putative mitochondrial protein [Cucumis melo var. makuwa]|uniref:Mitochondrial protein n=1 Tax=Cucumis melo var. makuwa TaxID=1194695 RepID=A0A5A7SXZ6_CUCMM|nr:putative mitochondrial protein [Cucumis melo var. makuwa]TYK19072.1 putative mitochondrial protein [Cucumis melo var. makuwa]
MPVDSSTLPAEVPKVDAQADGTDINSETISKEVIADNSELVPSAHVRKNHPSSFIIGDPSAGIITKKKEKVDYSKMIADLCYTCAIESLIVDVALKDEYWINAMQEELLQFRRDNALTLVPKPEGANIIEFEMSMVGELSCFLGLQIKQKSEEAVKRILKYIHGTSNFRIMYSYDTTLILVGYCDADWAYALLMIGNAPLEAEVSSKLPKSVLETVDSSYPATSGTHAPNVPKTLLSNMDSDDLDDVPLARLLKKTTVLEVTVEMFAAPFVSVHSQESSSIEEVFVPTPSIHHTSNVQPGPLIQSPLSTSFPSESNVAHASVPSDVSTTLEGRTDVRSDENEVDPPDPDIYFEEVSANADNNPTIPPSSPEIPIAP